MHTTGDLGSRRNSSASSGLFSASEFEERLEGITGFSTSATGASLQYLCTCVCGCVCVCVCVCSFEFDTRFVKFVCKIKGARHV
jgi:hypothetical protein